MSWLLAQVYDHVMQPAEEACLRRWRRELLSGARGRTLEIGAGTGANLPLYPADVEELVLLEPDWHMRRELARTAVDESWPFSIRFRHDPIEALATGRERFDTIVSTLVLCSVDEPRRSLETIRRLLEPDGQFLFLEHVAAPDDPGRRRWQERIEPVWKRLAGNCHLTRRTGRLIEEAGFELEECRRESMQKALPFVRPTVRGRARPDKRADRTSPQPG
jgi:SAM-dependent methyltransferase